MTREPLMGQIRLAWWRDALNAETLAVENQTGMTGAIRALDQFDRLQPHLVSIVDGWEQLIVWDGADQPAMLMDYADGRGAGLFGALAPHAAEKLKSWGRVWALWDLAGHVDDVELRGQALAQAQGEAVKSEKLRSPPMLAMMAGVAAREVAKGKGAPRALTPGLYLSLLRMQFFGR